MNEIRVKECVPSPLLCVYSHPVEGRNEAFLGGLAALKKAVSDPDPLREFHDLFIFVGRELA